MEGLALVVTVTIAAVVATRWRFIQLPVSVHCVAAFGVAAALINFVTAPSDASRWIFLAGCFISLALVAHGFWLHLQPNISRRQKYERFLGGIGLFFVAYIQTPQSTGTETWPDIAVAMAAAIAWLPAQQIAISLFVQPWTAAPGILPSTKLLRIHRLARHPGLLPVLAFFPVLVGPYVNLRYAVGARLERAPIVYLRSFGYTGAPFALGRIVTKVAFRFGMLFTIVHAQQKGSELLAQSPPTRQPVMITVEDDKWQECVISKLKISSAVIIDRSVSSDSLLWEIQKAKTLLHPSRIAILQKRGSLRKPVHGAWILEYDLDRRGEREARRALNRWFEESVFTA